MLSGVCSKDHYLDLLFLLQQISNNGFSLSHICTFFSPHASSVPFLFLFLKCCVDWGARKSQEFSQALSTQPHSHSWARPFPGHGGECLRESSRMSMTSSWGFWFLLSPGHQEAGAQGVPHKEPRHHICHMWGPSQVLAKISQMSRD